VVVAHITVKSVPVLRMGSINDVIKLRVLLAGDFVGEFPMAERLKANNTNRLK
jgi:hypothetical protein